MAPTPKKNLDVAIVYNRSNEGGIQRDARILEEYLVSAARASGQSMSKVKHVDPREVPVMCDIIIHLEIPYYAWFPYGRYNVVMVNPEWWVSEAYDGYVSQIDLFLFKNDSVRDTFKIVCALPDEKMCVVPWCTSEIGTVGVNAKREFLYLIGGSVSKAAAAKSLVSMWKETYPHLHVYTTRDDFDFGVGVGVESQKTNVSIVCKKLSSDDVINLQRSFLGHVATSEAEGFGYSAAEAETLGAYCILNHNDAYDSLYSEDPYVRFLPTNQVANEKTRSSQFVLDVEAGVSVLDKAIADFLDVDFKNCISARREASAQRRKTFSKGITNVLEKASAGVDVSRSITKTRHVPPVLTVEECPPISIITLIYNRSKFWDLALHNMMVTDYPRNKLEWVIVDDSDNMDESISHKISKIQSVLPGLNVVYVPFTDKRAIGAKRNAGVKRASSDILLMMDDDDHYPESSFRRRVAYLVKNPEKLCAVCTTIALYDLRTGISAVNVPPYDLSLGKRISEATLTFRRSFFETRKFEKINMAEGETFITGRESEVVEMPPQQIIVSFCHGTNSSSRRIPPSDVKPGCFWGFPMEFLQFIHKLAGVEVELENTTAATAPAATVSKRTR